MDQDIDGIKQVQKEINLSPKAQEVILPDAVDPSKDIEQVRQYYWLVFLNILYNPRKVLKAYELFLIVQHIVQSANAVVTKTNSSINPQVRFLLGSQSTNEPYKWWAALTCWTYSEFIKTVTSINTIFQMAVPMI